MQKRSVILCILDGWGYRAEAQHNAVALAPTPHFDALWAAGKPAFLAASGVDVGLPDGQMGNSEVGHLNLGAGRIVYQDLPRIDRAFAAGELAQNVALRNLAEKLRQSGGACHLMGLASPGGVHAHQRHMVALAAYMSAALVPVYVHAFIDGRDVAPQSALLQIAELEKELAPLSHVKIATLCGRYYAMDRDKRWDRVERAYRLLTAGEGIAAATPLAAIEASYAAGVFDEFMLPVSLNGYEGMKDGDAILFANFRADRARQILDAHLQDDFNGFARGRRVSLSGACGMVRYSANLAPLMAEIFAPQTLPLGLGEVIAAAGFSQLRAAETEKYPHVTYFFNGGNEVPWPNEERLLVPSPKVATYDLQPEMSAAELAARFALSWQDSAFDFGLINFANPDMVGHTGKLEAAIRAVAAVDAGLGVVKAAAAARGSLLLVTADHGNCEQMWDDKTNGPHTAHTLNLVPLTAAGLPAGFSLNSGRLADVAPTILDWLLLAAPAAMDGKSLLVRTET